MVKKPRKFIRLGYRRNLGDIACCKCAGIGAQLGLAALRIAPRQGFRIATRQNARDEIARAPGVQKGGESCVEGPVEKGWRGLPLNL
jgi:hypothetical protein